MKNTIFAEKTLRVAHFCQTRRRHALNFAAKTFMYSHKTAKFAKVFSLESFPLYGIRFSQLKPVLQYQAVLTLLCEHFVRLICNNGKFLAVTQIVEICQSNDDVPLSCLTTCTVLGPRLRSNWSDWSGQLVQDFVASGRAGRVLLASSFYHSSAFVYYCKPHPLIEAPPPLIEAQWHMHSIKVSDPLENTRQISFYLRLSHVFVSVCVCLSVCLCVSSTSAHPSSNKVNATMRTRHHLFDCGF